MELLLIRHGRSLGDDEDRVEGGGWDAPLTAQGCSQAERLTRRLLHDGYQCDVLYSSPMLRTKAVAAVLAGALELPICFDDRLREMHTGIVGGLTFKEAHRLRPEPEGGFRAWERIPGGECLFDQVSRVMSFYAELVDKQMEQRVCVVTHGGTVDIMLQVMLGLPINQPIHNKQRFRFRAGDTSLHKLTITAEQVTVHFLNDTSHLQ